MAAHDIDLEKLTFLVVEDQAYVRSLITQLLRSLGAVSILEESDGAAALDLLRTTTPDFVLCDIKMDPVDGLEFLRHVRSGRNGISDPRLPVVFLTSDSDRATVMAAIKSEVDGYLVKPVSLNDLKAKINAVLGKRRALTWK